MAYLIDKDAVIAEIERLMTPECGYAMNKLIDNLDTLVMKEVNLEKEMGTYFETMEVLEHEYIFEDTFQRIAKHFFELGLKAKEK